MRYKINFVSLALIILSVPALFSGCSISPFEHFETGYIVLDFGQEIRLDGTNLTIEFKEIIYDRRCPRLLECLWEGMAKVKLLVTLPGLDPATAMVGIKPSGDANIYPELAAHVGEYRFNLAELAPYPIDDQPIPHENYSAILEVTRINPEDDGLVIFSYLSPTDLMLDPLVINSAEISGNILTLSVSYGGGCEYHDFLLYMSPPAFMESYPVQANLYLHHNGHHDACDAYLTEELRFDLSPIRNLYYRSYGTNDDIVLNIYQYYSDHPGERIGIVMSSE
jgi:hypothetical protein